MNDILARLRNGESIEDIGNEFARLLNAAQSEYEAEVEAAEAEAKRQKEAQNAIKNELAADLAEALNAYVRYMDPDLLKGNEFTAAEIVESFDGILNFARVLKPAKDRVKVQIKRLDKSADEAIADFLNKFGW